MIIPPKDELKLLDDSVYTDGVYVYKDVLSGNEAKLIERVQDIPNTQQLVEYNHEKRVMVTKFIEGYHLNKQTLEYKTGNLQYTNEQFEQLFDTLIQMKERGVSFETHYRNLIYHPENGFVPIDYHRSLNPEVHLHQLIQIISLTQDKRKREYFQLYQTIEDRFSNIPHQLATAFKKVSLKEYQTAQKRMEEIYF